MKYNMLRLLVVVNRFENHAVNPPGLRAVSVLALTFTAYGLMRLAYLLYQIAGKVRPWRV